MALATAVTAYEPAAEWLNAISRHAGALCPHLPRLWEPSALPTGHLQRDL